MPAKKVNFIPKGYHVVTPYLAVAGASEAIVFYKSFWRQGSDAHAGTQWDHRPRRNHDRRLPYHAC